MKLTPVLVRLTLLTAVSALGYYAYNTYLKNSPISIPDKIKGITTLLPENIDTSALTDNAKKKLIDTQPIITQENSDDDTPVLGVTTQEITQQAKDVVTQTSQKILDEVKDIPKEQAAEITKQVCEQIISELEK